MNIKPYNNKILILPLPKKEEKIGSIVVAASANADLREGKVVAVSKDLEDVFKEGDLVLYPETTGLTQWINSEQYLWLRIQSDEVWGIVGNNIDSLAKRMDTDSNKNLQ